MKNVLFISLFLVSVSGCAVGSNDPTGDLTPESTDQGGEVTGANPTTGAPAKSDSTTNDKTQGSFEHTSQFDPAVQVIPNRPGHTPTSPDPGPVRGPVAPR
jgi:hypothetical protein